MESREYYLNCVADWVDPLPPPVVETYGNITVIRDDLLPYGAKSRYCDYLIKTFNKDELVYGGANPYGWGPTSMAYLCKKYNKKCTVFAAQRKEPTIYQKQVIELGGNIIWLKMGMMIVTKARARKYVEESPETRAEAAIGLEHETVLGSIIKVMDGLNLNPDEVWSVGSSGTLNRGLQLAFPNANAFVVQTGHEMSEREVGRATKFVSPYKYDQPVKQSEMPPFPSVPHYDAKAWKFIKDYGSKDKQILLYNVAGY